jgi:signal transduction histidine kinase
MDAIMASKIVTHDVPAPNFQLMTSSDLAPDARRCFPKPKDTFADGAQFAGELLNLFIAGRGDDIALLSPTGHIVGLNSGVPGSHEGLAKLIGVHVSVVYPPDSRDRGEPEQLLELARKQGQAEDEGWLLRPDGSRFWAAVIVTALFTPDGELKGFARVTRDLSDRKSSQERQAAYARNLQRLSQKLVQAHEDERERLAAEIHDEIGQSLAALKLRLHGVLTRVDAQHSADLIASLSLIDGIIQKTRSLSLDLRPRMLHDLGLKAALQWEINNHVKPSGIEVKYSHQGVPENLDAGLATGCFRIVQETISNVLRHSDATKVSITLKAQDARLNLMIKDNGRGFEPAKMELGVSNATNLGLLGMQERARALGGRLQISSAPGNGTTIRASLPIHHRVHGGKTREELR